MSDAVTNEVPKWTRGEVKRWVEQQRQLHPEQREDVLPFVEAALALQPPSEAESTGECEVRYGAAVEAIDFAIGAEWSHRRAVAALGLGSDDVQS